jgi:hypothetical protein
MGEVELLPQKQELIIHSVLFFYGDAANDTLSEEIANNIAMHWNNVGAIVQLIGKTFKVIFDIEGIWAKSLYPEMIFQNNNPRNNYFRLEEYASGNISFVDAINSNTGYFKLDNLLNNSTTAAHEYGHSIGLDHPHELDIRGKGIPGIMYPRGSIVDPQFQYNPSAIAGDNTNGGTMNPFTRKVQQEDINNLHLNKLSFINSNFAVLGGFSSVWHEKHLP